ncbi:MBL fold metallo-hydrolase [Streptacidiphilus sp. PB12-B1b]|uniref:MBL fold metallo-hydrolase n=1 Tax=Streptacidiphilus sp. PB12-B1b TaxID=2705012 RepID=UPI0015FC7DAD|nr:MBL fold metallo-hydrolase [Streptacidiphilus sp. PB12-B1b]QMU77709.1 MBL fold metallo-hydrolase [Streptacidiphilus sp. PB12-B1b]
MSHDAHLAPIADGLYAWLPDGRGTWGLANCGLLVSEGQAALIDTPYDLPRTRALLEAAAPVLGPQGRIGTAITTHSNGDHSYGLAALGDVEIIGTRDYLHALDHEPTPQQMHALVAETPPDQPTSWYLRRHFGRFDFTGIDPVAPTRTFSGSLELRIGAAEVRLVQAGPAHTDGDLWVHLPQHGVVFTGDVVFADDHPVHWAGPIDNVIDACLGILATGAQVIVPGHGPLMTPADLRGHIDYLRWVRDGAHRLHALGVPAQSAALQLIDSGRYPGLGLPERLAITVATEYRHLAGETGTPDLVVLVGAAARIALGREQARIPGQRSGADDPSNAAPQ